MALTVTRIQSRDKYLGYISSEIGNNLCARWLTYIKCLRRKVIVVHKLQIKN